MNNICIDNELLTLVVVTVMHRNRMQDEIDKVRDVSLSELRDPAKDEDRVQEDNWLVLIGICTHLGNGCSDAHYRCLYSYIFVASIDTSVSF